ncbi:MAG: TetR/AcrR family transcriptional regulator [Myxococcota bacterium]|jgi:AcrR family transcriptional regulator|nr:TetR/AcrR family transcriptional regulator [Myxococcota bacterium]
MPTSGPPGETPNRFERRRQQNRAALLDAAIELFQGQGVRDTKVEDICARADVAPRTFFNHFETREHLYEAIARQRAVQLAALLDGACEDPAPLDQRLPALFAAIGQYLDERPRYRELVGVMLRLGVEGGSEITRTRAIGQAARHFIENGVTRGEIGDRHAPEVLAEILVGALNAALSNWSASEDYSLARNLEPSARALCDLLSAGVATPGTTSHSSGDDGAQ